MPVSTNDLRPFAEHDGLCLTMLLPAPSHFDDAAHRFEIERKSSLREASDAWSTDEIEDLDDLIAGLPHDAGAAVVVVHAQNGPTLVEFIDDPVEAARTFEGERPRLAPLIEARQRTVSHVVVNIDLAGADIAAFDGGSVIGTDTVHGDTEHIHRGHPGGWSQRRFQQRAENTWQDNIDDVADAVRAVATRFDARLVAVVGPTRAQSMLVQELSQSSDIDTVAVEAGDPDGAADEIVRLTADVAASRSMQMIEAARESMAMHDLTSADEIVTAMDDGRVQTLLVHDDGEAFDGGRRRIDVCIERALRTGVGIHVVPNVAILDDGVAAILRW